MRLLQIPIEQIKYYIAPLAGLLILLGYYFPYFYLGESFPVSIHDNLDSNIAWLKVVIDQKLLLAAPDTTTQQIFNGLQRHALNGNFDLSNLFFAGFGMYWGYAINKLIMGIVGFIGTYLLLKNHYLKEDKNRIIITLSALFYGILPFWSFNLSVAGLPLIFYLFLNIRNGTFRKYYWLLFIVYAFYSSLVFSGVFLLIIISILWVHDYLFNKRLNLKLLYSILLLSGSYILSHIPLFYAFLFQKGYVSHRFDFVSTVLTFERAFYKFDGFFRKGQYHTNSIHFQFIFPVIAYLVYDFFKLRKTSIGSSIFILLTLYGSIQLYQNQENLADLYLRGISIFPIVMGITIALLFNKKTWYLGLTFGALSIYAYYHGAEYFNYEQIELTTRNQINYIPLLIFSLLYFLSRHVNNKAKWSFLFVLCSSLFYGFIEWDLVAPAMQKITAIIPIQLQRFHALTPMFWYILLGLSLFHFSKQGVLGKILVSVVLFIQFASLYQHSELKTNTDKQTPGFKAFYAVELFNQIKEKIGQPTDQYRVMSVGMHPAIALYNGFYCLDSYQSDYPLEYKRKFRSVIGPEIEKNEALKAYFDDWGSRCYAFSAERMFDFLNPAPKEIQQLDYNFENFKRLGGQYILSTSSINTDNHPKLQFLGVFTHETAHWTVHLYQCN